MICAKVSAQLNLLPDTSGFCAGDSAYIRIDKVDRNATIRWTTPYAVIENARRVPVFQHGKYYVRVSLGNKVTVDSTFTRAYPKPVIRLRDTVLCKGRPFYLDTKAPGMRYLWSNDETGQRIKIESSGTYWVKVTNHGCTVIDTATVKFLPGTSPNFSSEMSFCFSESNKTLSVKANPGTRILWSTGSIYPSINVTREGIYWVKTENKSCGEQTDSVRVSFKACDCEMIIPSSFSPNEDNRNDYFFPVLQCEYSYYNLVITDKWGNTVFSTNNPNGKWDGRFKGNLCPEEVYIYRIESIEKGSEKKNFRSGQVSLFR